MKFENLSTILFLNVKYADTIWRDENETPWNIIERFLRAQREIFLL